jgi:type II secretory pathway component PulK
MTLSPFSILNQNRGSILITSLWMLSIFSVMTAQLGFEASQHILLMKKEKINFESKADFLSGINLIYEAFTHDEEPHEDSLLDLWLGKIKLPEPWTGRMEIEVSDEESKLNLHAADEKWIKQFLKEFEEKEGKLIAESKDFIKQILKARSKQRIVSYEELYLLEDLNHKDLVRLKPYMSVFSESEALNINTVNELVLSSLIHSLSGDEFSKKELLEALLEKRKTNQSEELLLRSADLIPNNFILRLKLKNTMTMQQLLNQLLPKLTTDSETLNVCIQLKNLRKAEAILRQRPEGDALDILSWHEN